MKKEVTFYSHQFMPAVAQRAFSHEMVMDILEASATDKKAIPVGEWDVRWIPGPEYSFLWDEEDRLGPEIVVLVGTVRVLKASDDVG